MARTTVAAQLAKLRKDREILEKREKALLAKTNDKVLGQIVALAKDAGITAADIVKALGAAKPTKAKAPRAAKKGALAGKKVAAKYRNPVNPEQTWTGRGVSPAWVQALKTAGTLDTALIAAPVAAQA
ncbi:H-NS family nucleoid-associated regulatory protein [Limnohabitans sp.]|uniref:H-NS histone family protein n=1 Tax=Limnohabitans sp. TaxID=1907725 RepID=UPI0038BB5C4D